MSEIKGMASANLKGCVGEKRFDQGIGAVLKGKLIRWGHIILAPLLFVLANQEGIRNERHAPFYMLLLPMALFIFCFRNRRRGFSLHPENRIFTVATITSVAGSLLYAFFFWKKNKYSWGIEPSVDINYFLGLLLLFYVCRYEAENHEEEYFIGMCIVGTLILLCTIPAFREYIKIAFMGRKKRIYYRAKTVFRNPIPGGNMFILGFWLPTVLKNKKLEFFLKFLLYIPAVLILNTRSSQVSMLISILLFFALNAKSIVSWIRETGRKKPILLLLLLILLLAAAAGIYSQRDFLVKGPLRRLIYRSLSKDKGRLGFIKVFIPAYLRQDLIFQFFGHGFDSLKVLIYNSPANFGLYYCDNMFLTILYEHGLIAIAAIGAIVLRGMKYIAKTGIMNRKSAFAMAFIASMFPAFFYEMHGWGAPVSVCIMCLAIMADPEGLRGQRQEELPHGL